MRSGRVRFRARASSPGLNPYHERQLEAVADVLSWLIPSRAAMAAS